MLSAVLVLLLAEFGLSVRIPVAGRVRPSAFDRRRSTVVALSDLYDIAYFANVTLGEQTVPVLLDTSSSDLWISQPVQNSQSLGIDHTVAYGADQTVSGVLRTAQMKFAGSQVSSQVCLQVDSAGDGGIEGVLGLGPDYASSNWITLNNSVSGWSPLSNILSSTPATPILGSTLSRTSLVSDAFLYPGELALGEYLPGYTAVQAMPHLSITTVPDFEANSRNQHIQVLLDAGGVTVSGKPVALPSTVVRATSNQAQLTAVIDSSFAYPYVPKVITDAMYASLPGARLTNVTLLGEMWSVPCTAEVNVSLSFGGVRYPVHPLDISAPLALLIGDASQAGCVGIWRPIDNAPMSSLPNALDMILGAAFLRNVYTVINYGTLLAPFFSSGSAPYVQLLSTTNDTARVHAEFVAARLTPWATSATLRAASRTPGVVASSTQIDSDIPTIYSPFNGAVRTGRNVLKMAVGAITLGVACVI